MNVSVIICTYNRLNDLFICLDSLESQLTKPNELVIVDDSDTNNSEKILMRYDKSFKIEYIKNKVKQGLPAARNVGVKHAKGDIICFVDDDVILPLNWLQEIINGYNKHKDAVGVGGWVVNFSPPGTLFGNGTLYRLLSAIRSILFNRKIGRLNFIGTLYLPLTVMPDTYVAVDTLHGCNMSFKKDVFNLYKFDELYRGSACGEEVDFCTRLTKKDGEKLICNPNAIAIHKRAQSGGCEVSGNTFYWYFRNHTYYLLKNFNASYFRVLVFSFFALMYSIFTFKLVYLKAIKDGIRQYKQFRGKHEK